MKKFWLSALVVLGMVAPASAADLAARPYTKAPPRPPAPVVAIYDWTGFYIGANIGGAWAGSGWTDTLFLTTSNTVTNSVFIGGGQIGANYQIGQFVIGGEWDFDGASNINGGASIPGDIVVTNSNTRWITTVAARFGWAIDHFLFYGKAGGGVEGDHPVCTTLLRRSIAKAAIEQKAEEDRGYAPRRP